MAEKGAQILDHFRQAFETKDDELLFPGTAAGNPGYLLGIEGFHTFDSTSHDQLNMVNLLRRYLTVVHKSDDYRKDFYNSLSDYENHLLEFAIYRYPTVVNQMEHQLECFLEKDLHPLSRYLRRPEGMGWETEHLNHPFHYKPTSVKEVKNFYLF